VGGAYSLENVQADDALEREELEQDAMLRQSGLVVAVESQSAENGNGSDDDFDDAEPEVCKVDAVGRFAVFADCERYGGCDPDEESSGDELQDTVP
jgi:hypothetical protein